jgi:hypothetical protein
MDTSVFVPDLSAWLSWTSDALYVASVCLGVVAVGLFSCILAQIVTAGGHSNAPKRKTHLAH